MIYDVAVVGGGPIGSIAARYATMYGAKVAMFEEHSSIGSPVACTGLLSLKALQECDLLPDPSFVINSVRGAYVHAPDGRCLPIGGKKTRAYVVLRKILDRKLASMAAESGVDIYLKSYVEILKQDDDFQRLSVISNGVPVEFKSKVVIAADGPRSKISTMAGIPAPDVLLPGIQFETKLEPLEKDFVELFVGSIAPGFFGWVVPVTDHICRVGMAIEKQDNYCA